MGVRSCNQVSVPELRGSCEGDGAFLGIHYSSIRSASKENRTQGCLITRPDPVWNGKFPEAIAYRELKLFLPLPIRSSRRQKLRDTSPHSQLQQEAVATDLKALTATHPASQRSDEEQIAMRV